MSKVVRRSQRGPQRGEGSRRVFRRRRRIPTGLVVRQLLAVLLMLSGGIGVVVMLQRLRSRWCCAAGERGHRRSHPRHPAVAGSAAGTGSRGVDRSACGARRCSDPWRCLAIAATAPSDALPSRSGTTLTGRQGALQIPEFRKRDAAITSPSSRSKRRPIHGIAAASTR